MSAPVDVLAVMDADIALRRSIYEEGRGTKPLARTEQNAHNLACAIEARAAIAELIKTADRVWSKGGAVPGSDWDALGNALAAVGPQS